MLADIGLRGLSPAVNDRPTAVEALDAIDSLLRPLAARDLDIGRIWDEHGTLRVVVPMPAWEDFVAVALDELVPLSAGSTPVSATGSCAWSRSSPSTHRQNVTLALQARLARRSPR